MWSEKYIYIIAEDIFDKEFPVMCDVTERCKPCSRVSGPDMRESESEREKVRERESVSGCCKINIMRVLSGS